jgi:hypothetical protein
MDVLLEIFIVVGIMAAFVVLIYGALCLYVLLRKDRRSDA